MLEKEDKELVVEWTRVAIPTHLGKKFISKTLGGFNKVFFEHK